MKAFWKDFFLRGLICAAGGPVILGIIYGILDASGAVESLSPGEVCTGILTITLLAFIAAGMSAIYQVEKFPVVSAALIHGGVLYLTYILIYLINGWLPSQWAAIGGFTGIFAVSYAIIWLIIYIVTRAKARKLTQQLHSGQ